jgi:hypothetical protein
MADLFDILVRNQVYLEGLKRSQTAGFPKLLGQLDAALRSSLANIEYENLGDANKTQLNKLLVELRKAMRLVFSPYINGLVEWLERFMEVEADNFDNYYTAPQSSDPTALFAASKTEPMGDGNFWFSYLNGYSLYTMSRIERMVTNGYANRLTKQQIINGLIGTKSNNYRDGIGRQLDNLNRGAIATTIQHLSQFASTQIAKKVFGEYEWVSVLDDVTTDICRERDGNFYIYGRGPVPPAHGGCRSITVPRYDRAGTPDLRFGMWAKRQPENFVKDAFDGKVPSRYEGTAALTLEQYRGKRKFITA